MRTGTRWILVLSALLVVAIAAWIAQEALKPRPLVIALIGLEGRQREGFLRAAASLPRSGLDLRGTGNMAQVVEFESIHELVQLLEKPGFFKMLPELVITVSGRAFIGHTDLFDPVAHDLENRVPLSLRIALQRQNRTRALPLLVNSLEIASNRIWDSTLGFDHGSAAWFESLKAAKSTLDAKTKVPLLITGANDELLSLVISAFLLEEGGVEAYTALCREIPKAADPADLKGRFPAWDRALERLGSWKNDEILPANWLDLDKEDQSILLEEGRIIALVQTLACRREMPYQHIFTYRSGPFPGESVPASASKSLVAPSIIAAIPAASRRKEQANTLLDWMSSGDALWQLARDSGLAAATSSARQPDIQAMDSFTRSAAAYSTVNGIHLDAFDKSEDAQAFMTALRTLLSR